MLVLLRLGEDAIHHYNANRLPITHLNRVTVAAYWMRIIDFSTTEVCDRLNFDLLGIVSNFISPLINLKSWEK